MNNNASKLKISPASYEAVQISSETVVIPAGDAGAVVEFFINKKPIADLNGCFVGGYGDSSVAITSTAFDTEVKEKVDSSLNNGEFWVDYITGKCRGKKADESISAIINYKIFN